ncbi:hypothetical protein EAI_10351 [Harpegnathos saltator]|uniref:Uncharacterized protein n=1 Tax=Harpegnathos saltator TaxID=610380 RepID=E2BT46_HARSA|nr:hypothetical protein EAI_10351 [Harpegnathos saltator]
MGLSRYRSDCHRWTTEGTKANETLGENHHEQLTMKETLSRQSLNLKVRISRFKFQSKSEDPKTTSVRAHRLIFCRGAVQQETSEPRQRRVETTAEALGSDAHRKTVPTTRLYENIASGLWRIQFDCTGVAILLDALTCFISYL